MTERSERSEGTDGIELGPEAGPMWLPLLHLLREWDQEKRRAIQRREEPPQRPVLQVVFDGKLCDLKLQTAGDGGVLVMIQGEGGVVNGRLLQGLPGARLTAESHTSFLDSRSGFTTTTRGAESPLTPFQIAAGELSERLADVRVLDGRPGSLLNAPKIRKELSVLRDIGTEQKNRFRPSPTDSGYSFFYDINEAGQAVRRIFEYLASHDPTKFGIKHNHLSVKRPHMVLYFDPNDHDFQIILEVAEIVGGIDFRKTITARAREYAERGLIEGKVRVCLFDSRSYGATKDRIDSMFLVKGQYN